MNRLFLLLTMTAFLSSGLVFAQNASPATDGDAKTTEAAGPTAQELKAMTIGEIERTATKLVDDEAYEQALPYIQALASRAPDNIQAKILYAEVALAGGDVQKATPLFREAQRVDPNNYRTTFGLGRIYLMSRQWRQATNYLEKARSVAPRDKRPLTLRYLATAYRGSKHPTKAIDAATEALPLNPNDYTTDDYETVRTLVGAYIDAKRHTEAVEAVAQLERLAVMGVQASQGERETLLQLYDARNAYLETLKEYFSSLVEVDYAGNPTDQLKPGNEPKAAEITKKIVELMANQSVLELKLSYFEMIEIHKRVLEYAPMDSNNWVDHALLLTETGQMGKALTAAQKALELDSENERAKMLVEKLEQAKAAEMGAQPKK